ncbi:MAG: RNA polymerase sigma factor SigZ [Gammaproteobacteria bacterium]|nr:RNA polymerase sigma factor SigZ [Gammaproteobacteria bacterium]
MKPVADLWQLHRSRLRDYVGRRVREREAVDDILQEVYIKVQAGLHTVRSQGSISAWLYRIAANCIADHYRTQRPWEELPADDELAAPNAQPDPVEELAVCLQPFISELPETYRTALQLSEIVGLPQKEVAQRLGISLSGAKSRVQRGREKLRQRLLDCCYIETGRNGISGYEQRDGKCGVACG